MENLNELLNELVKDKYDLWGYVKDYLTDFNDNFVGEPCSEIIEEVLDYVDDGLSLDDTLEQIHKVCDNMFG